MEEEELAETTSKGKKGKGKSSARESEATTVQEAFDLNALERSMGEAVDKLRVALKAIVGRVGRLSPGRLKCSPVVDLLALIPERQSQICWIMSKSNLKGIVVRWPSTLRSL